MSYSFRLRIGVVLFLAASASGGAYFARAHYLPQDANEGAPLPGLRVDGATPTGDLAAFVRARADEVLDRRVHVEAEGGKDLGEYSLRDLGVTIDVDGVVSQALRAGHEDDVLARAQTAERARAGLVDVPLRISVDDATLAAIVARYKESYDTPPTSARMDLEHRTVIPEKDGHYLDAYGASPAVLAAARAPESAKVVVPVLAVAPRVTSEFVRALDIHMVLGEFETYFSRGGDQKRRGQNIDVAAAKLDGLVLSPGEVVSFNAVVGDRSEENGFQRSWEIFKGEMVEGVGGGTCQVASTFHAAVVFGGLDVLERLPHSRPSAYIPMGLDSTVVFPAVDLKVRNPHPFPVVVHTKSTGNTLRVELLGKSKPARVVFGRDVVATLPYKRKIVEEPGLPANRVVRKQHGIKGFRIKRTRQLVYENGTSKTEESTDFYPPTTEIYLVPAGFDEGRLPALPDADADPGDGPRTPAPSSGGAVACAGDCAKPGDIEVVNGRGVHAPTGVQVAPPRSVSLKR